ncbi:hypothetical protein H4R33_004415 [Dimargaris cristalligena]|uniref:Uncharacterized protein n=1 Tax=Dimargaris cristalligena TaxID=215637 RepID=A0A4P9ZYN5_9FUNG|nr:hypothetical protein H4R33_004415 [Dimargaris cristalligena]RKP37880.1 hypothetical protein BJ085DRAFT_34025 [Dimargaris cristalligena]|eukprot:RKP37880.1 hypothetical protein BJ085DRAFT_34025 [Dimargaris cristalligena]
MKDMDRTAKPTTSQSEKNTSPNQPSTPKGSNSTKPNLASGPNKSPGTAKPATSQSGKTSRPKPLLSTPQRSTSSPSTLPTGSKKPPATKPTAPTSNGAGKVNLVFQNKPRPGGTNKNMAGSGGGGALAQKPIWKGANSPAKGNAPTPYVNPKALKPQKVK